MGAKPSCLLSLEDIDDFCALTYFNRQDVLRLFHRFYRVNPDIVKSNPLAARLPASDLFNAINELKVMPLRRQQIFAFIELAQVYRSLLGSTIHSSNV